MEIFSIQKVYNFSELTSVEVFWLLSFELKSGVRVALIK